MSLLLLLLLLKVKHHGLITVQTAVAIGVCIFNDGCRSLGHILKAMKIEVSEFTTTFFADKAFRIVTAQRQAQMATKEARQTRRLRRLGRDEQQTEAERYPYLSGAHD